MRLEQEADLADTTTIRLPAKLRARVRALAEKSGRSAHSFILEAVERHTAYAEEMSSLVKDALAADVDVERTGEVYRAQDVHAWLERLAKGPAPRPKSWQR